MTVYMNGWLSVAHTDIQNDTGYQLQFLLSSAATGTRDDTGYEWLSSTDTDQRDVTVYK